MRNILIADSGSTKTDWRLIETDGLTIHQFQTMGLNPFHHSKESIEKEILEHLIPKIGVEVDTLYYYGAGCSSNEQKEALELIFKNIFKKAQISIYHDLLAAARATLGRKEGMVAILGTGSSAGYYDTESVKSYRPSLGYVLGDEGGGTAIGKRILEAYFYREMPEDLMDKFNRRYIPDLDIILNAIYREPLPNRYIATYSRFAFHHKNHPFIVNLLKTEFTLFFKRFIFSIPNYNQLELSMVGSVAYYYSDIIKPLLDELQIKAGTILEKPIAGLSLYHTELGD